MTGSQSTGRHGAKYPYYHHQRQNCSYAKFIPKESFEQTFVEYLHSITPSVHFEKAFREIVLDIWKTNFKNFDTQNAIIRNEINTLEQRRQRVFELHQSGAYTDSEFVDQKTLISTTIAKKKLLIHDKAIEEFNMDEALDYCFGFIRNTAQTWLDLEMKPEKRLRFQKLIFEENIPFSGTEFGNAKLSPIYSMYQEYRTNKSTMVTKQGGFQNLCKPTICLRPAFMNCSRCSGSTLTASLV